MKGFWTKIKRKWMKLRLQPIRVYCLHHVCAKFDEESMEPIDWMPKKDFKNKVQAMQQDGVEFISLTDAYCKITNDKFRNHHYAVLTFDDGYASLKEILPWLEEQKIPVTLFINGKYLDGKCYRENPKERYLTEKELFAMTSPLVEIGSHGWEHTVAAQMSAEEFEEYMRKNVEVLSKHPRYISFHAYTWGNRTIEDDRILAQMKIVPVLINGGKNYNDISVINRELMK